MSFYFYSDIPYPIAYNDWRICESFLWQICGRSQSGAIYTPVK